MLTKEDWRLLPMKQGSVLPKPEEKLIMKCVDCRPPTAKHVKQLPEKVAWLAGNNAAARAKISKPNPALNDKITS